MSSSNKRKTGGAWRRCKAMTALHAKQGKDRSRAKTNERRNSNGQTDKKV